MRIIGFKKSVSAITGHETDKLVFYKILLLAKLRDNAWSSFFINSSLALHPSPYWPSIRVNEGRTILVLNAVFWFLKIHTHCYSAEHPIQFRYFTTFRHMASIRH